jgi:hypothetical protein
MRAFPKGVTPRAEPIQLGWIGQLKQLWSNFFHWLSPEAQKNLEDIQRRFQAIWGGLMDWWNKTVAPHLPEVWKEIIDLLKTIAEVSLVAVKTGIEAVIVVVDLWLKAIQGVGDAFKAVNDWLDKINEHRYIPGMGEPKRTYPRSRDRWKDFPDVGKAAGTLTSLRGYLRAPVTIPYDPSINVTHYGYEKLGQFGYDWQSAHGIGAFLEKKWSLTPYGGAGIPSAALINQLARKYGLVPGQRFLYMGHMYRYEDIVPPGHHKGGAWVPYRDLRLDVYDPYGKMKASELGHPQASASNVTIHYNAPITIHGTGEDMERRLAAYHRRHIDQMKRDIAEVAYLNNRASFDGARAV